MNVFFMIYPVFYVLHGKGGGCFFILLFGGLCSTPCYLLCMKSPLKIKFDPIPSIFFSNVTSYFSKLHNTC